MAEPRLEVPACDMSAVLALERELGVSDALAQVLVRRGHGDAGRRARVPRRGRRASRGRVRRDRCRGGPRARARARRLTNHRPRRLRRRRRVLHGGARALPAAARSRGGLVPAQPLRRRLRPVAGHRPAPRRARDAPAGDRRLRDHRGRGGRAARGRRASTCSSPTTTGRARTAPCRTPRSCTPRSRPTRARTCARPASPSSSRRRSRPPARDPARAAAADDLDLVALATVADCVPLLGENRRLVRAGLRALAGNREARGSARSCASPRPTRAGSTRATLGFRLAPRINAAGRLHRADAGLELVLTEDEARAAAVAEELDRANARAPRRRDAHPGRRRSAGGRGGRAAGLRARRRRLAPRRDRDRRLARGRAPSPPGVLIALDGDAGHGVGPLHPGASTCSPG